MSLVEWLDRRFYPAQREYWDDDMFRKCVLSYLRPHYRLLDIGAGAGILPQTNFRGLAAQAVGIDLDERVRDNPHLDLGVVANCESIPFDNDSFDVIVADNVLEHLAKPEVVFGEIRRVLRPGGVFIAKTPNKFHYMPLAARLTPHSFHQWYNALRGRAPQDTFPTLYRANSRARLRELASVSGLELVEAQLAEGRPEYLRISAPTYVAGILYERLVNAASWLAPFRILLVAVLRKGGPSPAASTQPDG